jgi:hypothetical protein
MDGMLLLSFRTYTQYFLVPHITCCLIAEDKNTDLEGGWEIMVRSAEVGDTLQSLTAQEDLLETISTANAKHYKERSLILDNKALTELDATAMANPVKVEVAVSLSFISLIQLSSLYSYYQQE